MTAGEISRVGPKGFIHGWIFVGAPGVGAHVHHPQHGHGIVTAHDGSTATVRFTDSGAKHSFQARKGPGKGQLVPHEPGASEWGGSHAGPGSASSAAAEQHIAGLRGKIALRNLDDPHNVHEYERRTLDPVREKYTPAQTDAVNHWVDTSHQINAAARGQDLPFGQMNHRTATAAADELSAAMTPLPDDLMLLREVGGKDLLAGMEPGSVISDEGFSSTTLRPGRFAGGQRDRTVLHILAPKGTPFVWAGRLEDELLLDRRQAFVIMGAPSERGGVTHINVLALPKGMGP